MGGEECVEAEPDLPHVRLDRVHGAPPGVHQEEGAEGGQGGADVGQAEQEKELRQSEENLIYNLYKTIF